MAKMISTETTTLITTTTDGVRAVVCPLTGQTVRVTMIPEAADRPKWADRLTARTVWKPGAPSLWEERFRNWGRCYVR